MGFLPMTHRFFLIIAPAFPAALRQSGYLERFIFPITAFSRDGPLTAPCGRFRPVTGWRPMPHGGPCRAPAEWHPVPMMMRA